MIKIEQLLRCIQVFHSFSPLHIFKRFFYFIKSRCLFQDPKTCGNLLYHSQSSFRIGYSQSASLLAHKTSRCIHKKIPGTDRFLFSVVRDLLFPFFLLCRNLISGIQLIIFSFLFHQLIMGTALNNLSLLKNHDTIGVSYGRQTMCDNKGCSSAHQLIHTIPEQCARYGYQWSLSPHRESVPADPQWLHARSQEAAADPGTDSHRLRSALCHSPAADA